jgi:transposase-like protein
MSKDNVVSLPNPAVTPVLDPLTEVLQQGARRLLAEAVEAEVERFLEQHREQRDEAGRQRIVRNGHLPLRTLQTGIGGINVEVPRVRDRAAAPAEPIRFTSGIIPKYLRKSASVEALIPCLYLKGISTRDFQEALAALVGPTAAGFSAATVSRLKAAWEEELRQWQRRELQGKQYIYLWADGIYFSLRSDTERACVLVIIGATAQGQKELVALEEGFRESTASWQDVLQDLKRRGLTAAPALAVGDGALGFWGALREVYPSTSWQRCWVHKTVNVLDKLPKRLQSQAKTALQEIWMAATRQEADRVFDAFLTQYGAKYPKAVQCLAKDRDTLLTFYDFPAEHWIHVRTTNPIESTFATVRLRTVKTRNCVSRMTVLTMVFKLCQSAQPRWLRLRGVPRLAEVIRGVPFVDGVKPSLPAEVAAGQQEPTIEVTRSAA